MRRIITARFTIDATKGNMPATEDFITFLKNQNEDVELDGYEFKVYALTSTEKGFAAPDDDDDDTVG